MLPAKRGRLVWGGIPGANWAGLGVQPPAVRQVPFRLRCSQELELPEVGGPARAAAAGNAPSISWLRSRDPIGPSLGPHLVREDGLALAGGKSFGRASLSGAAFAAQTSGWRGNAKNAICATILFYYLTGVLFWGPGHFPFHASRTSLGLPGKLFQQCFRETLREMVGKGQP